MLRFCLAAVAWLTVVCSSPNSAGAYSLLSIDGASLPRGAQVIAIELKPTSYQIMAVCHAPAGWSISVFSAPGGTATLNLKAPSGGAAVSSDRFDEFQHIAMLPQDVTDDVTGTLTVREGEGTGAVQQVALSKANFRLSQATRCPAVRAARLLSIEGFRIKGKPRIEFVDLTLPHAHLLALCHSPNGWSFDAEMTPDGIKISGGANGTVAEVDQRDATVFKDSLLLDDTPIDLSSKRGEFGTIEYGTFPDPKWPNDDAATRSGKPIVLGPKYLVLKPAIGCPDAYP